ncbi:MAG TPA: alpha/beta fold hydrolase [Candidatus Angelobacter sp.]|nr:alpha/beta fold hydrolase [Candidatus Angelobacter sp.]
MIRKILKYTAIAVACLIFLVVVSGLSYRKYRQHKIADERAISSPHGIDSLEAVQIGGIEQWIHVRGEDLNNPILLFIHGGPGVAFIPLAGVFQGPWEKYFTVVQWDQRGAGKTYAANDRELQRRTMNLPQMEQDTLDVANYLRSRFKRDKIFVVGHSWGSALGLWLAHEHPELIYAYVGSGQVVSMEQNADQMYQDDLQAARSRHNNQAVRDLESVVSRPSVHPALNKIMIANRWAGELLGPPPSPEDFTDVKRILSSVITSPDYSLADDLGFIRGQAFSLQVFLPQLTSLDLSKLGPEFRVPVFFFEGRQDPFCRPSLIRDYSQTITAPKKEFVWFESSGHFPFFEEKQKFTDELVQKVLPLAR